MTLRDDQAGECFHSLGGARQEAERLYIHSSGIREFWASHAPGHVLDVGLGLGYNACATIASWWAAPAPGPLRISSLERHRELTRALASGVASWQKGWPEDWRRWCRSLRRDGAGYRCEHAHPSGAALHWEVRLGEARETVTGADSPPWDFIWQDPFSSGPGSEALWQSDWFRILRLGARPEARLMTYRVARSVRDALAAGGWDPARIPGAGSKRSWLRCQPLVPAEKARAEEKKGDGVGPEPQG